MGCCAWCAPACDGDAVHGVPPACDGDAVHGVPSACDGDAVHGVSPACDGVASVCAGAAPVRGVAPVGAEASPAPGVASVCAGASPAPGVAPECADVTSAQGGAGVGTVLATRYGVLKEGYNLEDAYAYIARQAEAATVVWKGDACIECSSGVFDCWVCNGTGYAQFQYTVVPDDHIPPHIILGKLGEAECRVPSAVGPKVGRGVGEGPPPLSVGTLPGGAIASELVVPVSTGTPVELVPPGRATTSVGVGVSTVSLLGEECTLLGGEVVPTLLGGDGVPPVCRGKEDAPTAEAAACAVCNGVPPAYSSGVCAVCYGEPAADVGACDGSFTVYMFCKVDPSHLVHGVCTVDANHRIRGVWDAAPERGVVHGECAVNANHRVWLLCAMNPGHNLEVADSPLPFRPHGKRGCVACVPPVCLGGETMPASCPCVLGGKLCECSEGDSPASGAAKPSVSALPPSCEGGDSVCSIPACSGGDSVCAVPVCAGGETVCSVPPSCEGGDSVCGEADADADADANNITFV